MELGVLVDVCIGVLAVVVVFSLAASATQEFIADNILRLRGRTLRKGIEGLLARWGTVGSQAFYNDPAMQAIMDGGRLPSAIEPRHFAEVARKILGPNAPALPAVAGMLDPLEVEFNEAMNRVSGWYLRRTRWWLFGIGVALAVAVNVDILTYSRDLLTKEDAREKVAAYAEILGEEKFAELAGHLLVEPATENAVGSTANVANAVIDEKIEPAVATEPTPAPEPASAETIAADAPGQVETSGPTPDEVRANAEKLNATVVGLFETFQGLGIQTGWNCTPDNHDDGVVDMPNFVCEPGHGLRWPNLTNILSWLLIGVAVTLGAQFWFDLFRTLINMRSAGKTGGPA